ncbi:lysozyme inhibitor LprI family protein [Leptotrichia sp. oral taxon 879]|uniref:lysozyme inhibitor LprI family protein n=1 Tax=Leptotrichia sp. oral taxon 879 TaxID=1227267 RepID=UPI0003ADE247|nr:lysozyme inhibitor LprI family protein [Leptotrichia sp. oral taxon 879]ERK50339.1 hypothetical protein HMPREF1552_01422 [Leptotrichia sp. oral taxon 879 str. F0557]
MKVKNIIVKLTIILSLFLFLSCQNKNSELEKKVEKLEKENAEILKKQKEQQNAQENTANIKKEEKTLQPKIKNYEDKIKDRIADYEAARDKVSEEYGWSVEETQANEKLNEKLDDELTKVYNLIRERMSESRKIEFRNEQRQWIKNRKKKVENSNNGEDGNPGMGGRAGANVEILTYQELTKDRLIKFARMYDNME